MQKTHGGKRVKAGRPRGVGPYGEKTTPIRIPNSKVDLIKRIINQTSYKIPLYSSAVPAGFPSPADDHIESLLDLNTHLIQNPSATFMVRAIGDSMIGAGIHSGDILIVDRSMTPISNKIVIAAVDGELTVKRLYIENNMMQLRSENPAYPPIHVQEEQETMIWGVVTNVIHSF